MSVDENCLEGIVVSYQFQKFDVYDNDIYFFKVEDANSMDKLNKLFRKHWGRNVDFINRKNYITSVKVKNVDIEDFFNFHFEKKRKYDETTKIAVQSLMQNETLCAVILLLA